MHPDDLCVSNKLLEKHFAGELDWYDFECRMKHKNGHWVWIHSRGRLVSRSPDGKPLRMFGTHTDITRRKKVEEVLRISNERFNSLMENASEGFYLFETVEPIPVDLPVDEQIGRLYRGRVLECNDAQAAMYGYESRSDVIGRTLAELHGGSDIPENLAFSEDWIENGYSVTGAVSKELDKEGKEVWFSNNVTGVVEEGMLVRVWGTQTDVTSIMHTEARLRLSEERYKKAQAVAHVGSWEYELATDTFWGSEEGRQIYGLSMDVETFSGDDVMSRVLDRQRVEQAMADLVEHGKPYDIEFDILSGGTHKTIHSIAELVTDKDGNPVKVTGVLHDVTEKKQSDQVLQDREQQYQNLFMNSPDAIFVNLSDKVSLINRAGLELFGAESEDQIVGKNPYELFHPDFHEQIRERIHHLRDLGEIVPLAEERIIRVDNGAVVDVDVVAAPFTFNGQWAIHVILRDITETKMLNERLRQAEKMEAIGSLAGGIAHDFNNILSGILGSADLAHVRLPPDSPIQKQVRIILQSADRAKDLVRQILSFSRQSTESRSNQQVAPIVKEAVELLRASLPSTIEIRTNIENDSRPIFADPTRIHEVVMNLATNAAHAMKQKGVLEISHEELHADQEICATSDTIPTGHYSVITVQDTGCGMDNETLSRIFEPFFTTKPIGEGTGMGMAVVYGIVKTYEGALDVNSSPGMGATIRVYLPKSSFLESEKASPHETLERGDESILFVDDEDTICRICADLLEDLGYAVHAIQESHAALSHFKETPDAFDLIITDQTMPGMTGIELIKAVRQIRQDIPIILCTGYAKMINEGKALEAGADAFIAKPYRQRNLAHRVRRLLDRRR